MERRENLENQFVSSQRCAEIAIDDNVHGRQRCTTPLVKPGVYSSQYTTFGSESRVPSFLVKMDVPAVEVVEEVGVANVQLMWRDADDGAWYSISSHSSPTRTFII
jgi:hypothetical protein